MMKWYCGALSNYPYVIVATVATIVAACLALSLTLHPLPTFNDPSLGFTARGTAVSDRMAAWKAMIEATRPSGPLTVNPYQPKFLFDAKKLNRTMQKLRHIHMVCVEALEGGNVSVELNCTREDLQQLHLFQSSIDDDDTKVNNLFNSSRSVAAVNGGTTVDASYIHRSSLEILRKLGLHHDLQHNEDGTDYMLGQSPLQYDDYEDDLEEHDEEHDHHDHRGHDGFFCGSLVPGYGHVVVSIAGSDCAIPPPPLPSPSFFSFSSGRSDVHHHQAGSPPSMLMHYNSSASINSAIINATNLLTLPHLKSMCNIDNKMRQVSAFSDICQKYSKDKCCPSWSLPNYIAMLANKTHCDNITEEDVAYTRSLLLMCGRRLDLSLSNGCGTQCSRQPTICIKDDAVYTILHYLTDVNFLSMHNEVTRRSCSQQHLHHHYYRGAPPPSYSSSSMSLGPSGSSSSSYPNDSMPVLHTSAVFLPIPQSAPSLSFYQQILGINLTEGNVTVVSMALGVKDALFDELLRDDAVLVMVAGTAVLVLVYFYTASLLITAVTLLTVVSSLILAYFLYTIVFRIAFFPYMNVLTTIIAVGLGADDIFVLCRVWNSVAVDHDPSDGRKREVSSKFVEEVMNHAASSVIVTSFTTAAAFLASMTSPITAIKCFSLFAGSVVLSNLLLMLTWVPATLVIVERWQNCCCLIPFKSTLASNNHKPSLPTESSATNTTVHHHNPAFSSSSSSTHRNNNNNHNHQSSATPSSNHSNNSPSIIPLDNTQVSSTTHTTISPPTSPPNSPNMHSSSPTSPRSSTSQSPPHSPTLPPRIPSPVESVKEHICVRMCLKVSSLYSSFTMWFFEKMLPWVVITPRLVWVVLLAGVASYASVLVLYYPRLRLPETSTFQLFDREHYFERYDLDHKYNFWFERNLQSDMANRLPIRIVWGIKPVDNGDHFNPASEATLELDPTFDISAPESQTWLLKFCRNIRNQSFYMSTFGPLLPNCFIETFKAWMEERRCKDATQNRYPCCDIPKFPYPRWVFNRCVEDAIKALYQTSRRYFVPGVAGPKFNKTSKKIVAMVVEYDSTSVWSLSYGQMRQFFTEVETWTKEQMATAPAGLRGGWFTSFLEFYEVQQSLLDGTSLAVLVAIIVSLVVLFITTLNVVVSIVAVLSVAAVMMVTLSGLVMLGWHLNVLESIVVTAAIGLAVDLTLHFAVAYTKAPNKTRKAAVSWAVKRLGSPVLMTTFTTLAAAIAMIPATVLAYVHIATFLILIAVTSFVYSTFFFLPVMSILGPEESCGQVNAGDCSRFCSCRESENHDKSVYQQACVSESTLSTSSVCPSAPYTSITTTHDFDSACMNIHVGAGYSSHEMEPLTSPTLGSNTAGGNFSNIRSGGTVNVPGITSGMQRHSSSCKQNNSACGKHKDNHRSSQCHQPGSLGLIVSMQQCRQSRHFQQNGSCAQLVVRKESTESQASGAEVCSSVSRSASVGSRPVGEEGGVSNAAAPVTPGGRSNGSNRKPVDGSRSGSIVRNCRRGIVAKQDSSPHITPANSVSTLVYSEPDVDLDSSTTSEYFRAQLENKLSLGSSTDAAAAGNKQVMSAAAKQQQSSSNYLQQLRQKQFAKQRQPDQQHCFSSSASMV